MKGGISNLRENRSLKAEKPLKLCTKLWWLWERIKFRFSLKLMTFRDWHISVYMVVIVARYTSKSCQK